MLLIEHLFLLIRKKQNTYTLRIYKNKDKSRRCSTIWRHLNIFSIYAPTLVSCSFIYEFIRPIFNANMIGLILIKKNNELYHFPLNMLLKCQDI